MENRSQVLSYIALLALMMLSYTGFSQTRYKVLSIDSIPVEGNYYFVKLEETGCFKIKKKSPLVLVEIKSDSSKTNTRLIEIISVDEKYIFQLHEMKENPFAILSRNERGVKTVFIDGMKVYDPDDILYYSENLNNLRPPKRSK